MPLQQLVEYFNDRLADDQQCPLRPFKLHNEQVYGVFGPLHVSSNFYALNSLQPNGKQAALVAQCHVLTAEQSPFDAKELDQLLQHEPVRFGQAESIIHFDRLTRTLHMLNYLPHSHESDLLFLDVDPRHIFGVKTDHGAYFEEILHRCGLSTQQVVITLSIHGVYGRFYQTLLKGLRNYQQRGYKVAIKLDFGGINESSLEFIQRSAADFIGLSNKNLHQYPTEILEQKTTQLNFISHSIEAKRYVYSCGKQPNQNGLYRHFDYWQSVWPIQQTHYVPQPLKRCS